MPIMKDVLLFQREFILFVRKEISPFSKESFPASRLLSIGLEQYKEASVDLLDAGGNEGVGDAIVENIG